MHAAQRADRAVGSALGSRVRAAQIKRLTKQSAVLVRNISILFRTAQAELQRKDRTIAELRFADHFALLPGSLRAALPRAEHALAKRPRRRHRRQRPRAHHDGHLAPFGCATRMCVLVN